MLEPWHFEEFLGPLERSEYKATWRLKERMKTAGVALVLCLNLGTDPPDVIKPVPCARRECWFDPAGVTKQKKLEIIGNALQQQYEKWQGKAKYKQCLDPTSEDLRRVCINLRKAARNDRLLFHYNGHGVPMPTKNGELWLFGKHYTHYMPVAIFELKGWLGEPAIYVLDCSCAGALLPHFIDAKTMKESMIFCEREMQNKAPRNNDGSAAFVASYDGDDVYGYADGISYGNAEQGASNQGVVQEFYSAIEGTIVVLAACQANQILPMNPLYPADVFTSCLTTPMPIALRWFILQTPFSMQDIDPGLSENIPGKENDRKTPKGELNWIFTAITDTIAWTTLPSTTFQKIFRQDLLVASLFRNFLLAKRIMKSFQCTPQSWPPLPDSTSHPLWNAWDLAAESCLMHVVYMQQGAMMTEGRNNIPLGDAAPPQGGQLTNAGPPGTANPPAPPGSSSFASASGAGQSSSTSGSDAFQAGYGSTTITPVPAFNQNSFFTDNLTAFGMWLDFGGGKLAREVPMHLPILLQVLLSQTHRLHALVLLRRYLALGPKAVNLALLVGIFPYILKLLQSPTAEIKQVLVCVWASIIGFDSTCRVELVRDKNQSYFVQYLIGAENPALQRCMAAFVLAELCNNYREGQQAALQQGLHRSCVQILTQPEVLRSPLLKRWTCLCIFKFCEDFGWSKYVCLAESGHAKLYPLLEDPDPTVRASAVLALGEMFGASDPGNMADGITAGFNAGSEVMGGAEQQQILREREQELAIQILESCTDGSVIVRKEALIALSKFVSISAHTSCISIVVSEMMRLAGGSSSGAANSEDPGENIPIDGGDGANNDPPWILSAGNTRTITDTVAKHLSSSTLFGEIVDKERDPRDSPTQRRSHMPTRTGSNSSTDSLPSASGEGKEGSVPGDEEGHAGDEPDVLPMKSRNALLAAGYVGLWLALFEVHGKDPHPEIRKAAAAIINWMHSHLPGEKSPSANPNDMTPPRQISPTGRSGGPDFPLSPQGIATEGRSSPRTMMGRMSPKRAFMGSADAFDSPSPSIPTPDQLAGAVPLEPPNDIRLRSHLYKSLRQMFATPEDGSDSHMDPLSVEGGECLYREEMLRELDAQERKLREFGTELMASVDDPSPYASKGGSMLSPSSPDGLAGGSSPGPAIKNTKFEQRTILNIDTDMTNHVMFHSFLDVLAVSDGKDVGVWNLQSGSRVMSVRPPSRQNHVFQRSYLKAGAEERPSQEYLDRAGMDPRITAMQWVNESRDALLMLGADNGTVTLWRDSSVIDPGAAVAGHESIRSSDKVQETSSIASCFFALPDVADTTRGSGLVMSWQQSSGTLVVGGNSNTLRLWDLGREQCVRVFNTGFDTCTTALASRAVSAEMNNDGFSGEKNLSWTFAGFADGSIAVFDERAPGSGCVSSAREHSAWVVGAYFRPDVPEIITGSVRGTVKFWDLRTMRSVKTLEVHKSPLTALAVHPCVPILATGSHAQFIKILTLGGEQLGGIIKYHDGFLGQRIGPVSCLAFHPAKMMLAMGATDSIVSVYQASRV